MGKFDLERTKALRPTNNNSEADEERGEWMECVEKIPQEAIPAALEIAKEIIAGQREIAVIRANADAKEQETEQEIRRIVAETENYVKRLEAENKDWHSRFDKRSAVIEKMIADLGRHPEWSDQVKEKIINLAATVLGV
ncbi:MAG: hypothetical protein IJU44_10540 [Kiritimatiellae bacterium]|nr:hypothetical protein [Kiritimatiellia bacterium]